MGVMPNKPIEIPTAAAKAFVRGVRAYFAAGSSTIKADAIPARQLQPCTRFGFSMMCPARLSRFWQ